MYQTHKENKADRVKKNNQLGLGLTFAAAMILLLAFPSQAARGTKDGLQLAIGFFIPAMFPYFVLTAFLTKSGAGRFFEALLAPVCRLLHLPESSAPVLLMGFLGGYPAGASAAGELVSKGEITPGEAERLMKFCINAGPGFVLGAVGNLLHSPQAGLLLYIAHLTPSILIGIITALPQKGRVVRRSKAKRPFLPFSSALVESARSAALSALYSTAFITLFCTIIGLMVNTGFLIWLGQETGTANFLLALLSSLLEVTKGCSSSALLTGYAIPAFMAFALGFSGLSVIFQVMAFLPIRLHLPSFLLCRLIHGGLSAALAVLLTSMFPKTMNVFAGPISFSFVSFSTTPQVTAFVLLLSCLLIAAIEKRRKL